ncbi:MAG TPA: D-Ala-D-Ala carboxypeptidase family metallohydrolase [Gammaproteobacteria bacterium]
MLYRICAALVALVSVQAVKASPLSSFDPGRAGFAAQVKGLDIGYREFALFAMPGEVVPVSVPDSMAHFQTQSTAGNWRALGVNSWQWTAPVKPGHYTLDITRDDGARIRLETFVLVPATEVHNGKLNGYRIGHYPQRPLKGLDIYKPPTGFVEVTPAVAQVHVSPHFTLGQFLCKEGGGYPKYVVLRRRLLLKLEAVVDYLDAHGVPPDDIHVMSGYRTPWYNAQLGNVPYSRHTWGDAADLYISGPHGAGDPGDLNHDGRDDYRDSQLLAADFSKLFQSPAYDYLRGGIGSYPATSTHKPFVHVDARGFRARW